MAAPQPFPRPETLRPQSSGAGDDESGERTQPGKLHHQPFGAAAAEVDLDPRLRTEPFETQHHAFAEFFVRDPLPQDEAGTVVGELGGAGGRAGGVAHGPRREADRPGDGGAQAHFFEKV